MNLPSPSGLRQAVVAVILPVIAAGALTACGDSPAPAAAPDLAPTLAPTASEAARPGPAPATHMININGHTLAFYVTPGRLPAIVLDAGGGEDATQWKDLVPWLSAATGSQIITYDRAGMGRSDEVEGPWNARAAASDLSAGLRRLGVTKVVLVSHSQAGEVATHVVRAHPGLVSGAVLVDANLPPFFTDEEITRLVAATTPQIEALKKQPSTRQTRQLIATAANFGPAHRAYHQISWPTAVPATVIVSGRTPFEDSPVDARRWRDAAAAFVQAGPGRTLVTAAGSSHEVPRDDPRLVLKEVEKMVAARG